MPSGTMHSMGKKKKNPAAVELGRLGGLARARKHNKEELSEIGRKGAKALWRKVRGMEKVLSDRDALAEWLSHKAEPSLEEIFKLALEKGKEKK